MSTRYVKRGFAVSDDVVLCTTSRTRTVFRPGLHGGGVRGYLIRQKIGADGTWKDTNEVNFQTVPADCGVSIELDTSATQLLFDKLGQLYEVQKTGVSIGDQKYLVAKEGTALLIDDTNKAKIIKGLLESTGGSEEFWKALGDSSPELAGRLAASKILLDRQRAISGFERSLLTHASDEGFWQKFFETHPWMLQVAFSAAVFMLDGETYVGGKRAKGRQGVGGVATDFLFSDDSTKSFAVVEIKTPAAKLVGPQYRGGDTSGLENETYSMSAELSGSVVQVRNQVSVALENFGSVLGPTYDELGRVHPKGVLVIGSVAELSDRQRESFNHFRHGLHGLTVITFDETLRRLQVLFEVESGESDNRSRGDNPPSS